MKLATAATHAHEAWNRAEHLANEKEARVALAAAYRIVAIFGWTSLISNHLTLRLPGEPEYFLIKPHDLLFEEVTASSLMKIHLDQPRDESSNVNKAGYAIHSAVLKARPDINAVVHIHTDEGMSVSALKSGLKFMTQASMRFYNRIGYHDYGGISDDESEGDRMCRDLGADKAMILRNHGLLTVGGSIGDALVHMTYLVTACKTQLDAEGTGQEILIPPPEVCEHAARQWEEYDCLGGKAEWPALVRLATRLDPSFRD